MYCKMVSNQVREAMWITHSRGKKKRKESRQVRLRLKNDLMEEMSGSPMAEFVPSDEEGQVRLTMARSVRDLEFGQAVHGSTSGHGSSVGNSGLCRSSRVCSASGSGSVESR